MNTIWKKALCIQIILLVLSLLTDCKKKNDLILAPFMLQSGGNTAAATGLYSLFNTVDEPAGVNCPLGGVRIDAGPDTNNNGILDPDEVDPNATSYVCNFGPGGAISPSTGVVIEIKSVSRTSPVTVRFKLKDDRGYPLDIGLNSDPVYSINTAMQPRFAMGYYTKYAGNNVSPLIMYTKIASVSMPAGSPGQYSPTTLSENGTLTEVGRGAGEYNYVFPDTNIANGPFAVDYDPAHTGDTHVVWIEVTRQTDLTFTTNAKTFYAANTPYYFVPNDSQAAEAREIVSSIKCAGCHDGFKPESTTTKVFHSGRTIDPTMCNICHNPGRTSNLLADSASFVHRIHNSKNVADANLFHGLSAAYPRDTRDCNACHGGAKQGGQALSVQNRISCQGCHDYVSFNSSAGQTCGTGGQVSYGGDGKPVPCNHVGGPQTDDNSCTICHGAAASFPVEKYHIPIVKPDPNNTWNGGNNSATNASYIAAGGYIPFGADVITYDVLSVSAWNDGGVNRPQITFKFKRNGADVVFSDPISATELMPSFVGSPSVYFAFAVPQDGINSPADFNVLVQVYIKNIWNGTATGTGAGTISGPDGLGYYTIKSTGAQIPATATMLTGGIGYSYSLSTTPPLVQTNVPGFPWTLANKQGGLSIPPPNVWKVASGYTGRRTIVDNNKCKNCHGVLGVAPTYHSGQSNDAPSCSICHTPNRTSSGWSAGSKYFIHAVHGGRKRSVPYTWRADGPGINYSTVGYPAALSSCSACHINGTHDFTNSTNLVSVDRQQLTTVAAGIYNSDPLTNPSYYMISPYVVADGITNYGMGFSFNAGTGITNQAAGTTLVMSQITSACVSCHDSAIAVSHMASTGGSFYQTRSAALAGGNQEQCLLCHGPGKIAAIGTVHKQ